MVLQDWIQQNAVTSSLTGIWFSYIKPPSMTSHVSYCYPQVWYYIAEREIMHLKPKVTHPKDHMLVVNSLYYFMQKWSPFLSIIPFDKFIFLYIPVHGTWHPFIFHNSSISILIYPLKKFTLNIINNVFLNMGNLFTIIISMCTYFHADI